MASSPSWSSDLLLQRTRRIFRLIDANRTLPLVKRIVSDIVRTHEQASNIHSKLELRMSQSLREQVEHQLESRVDELKQFVEELERIGCEVKDHRMGLVNFTGKYQGREIYYCWRLGEDRIEHWHEIHDDYEGRKSIALLLPE